MKKPKAIILARVSTKTQETDRQVEELEAVAKERGWLVKKVFREVVSGAAGSGKGWEIAAERKFLSDIILLAEAGKVDKVMVHEVSRIARRNSDAHRFVERLTDAGVSLYWHSQAIETLLPSGKPNPAARIMFALLAEFARSEREILRERIVSGLNNAKKKGVKLGRPLGSEARADFLKKHEDIVSLTNTGISYRAMAEKTGKSVNTVSKVVKILKEMFFVKEATERRKALTNEE